jgi:hypothetical protein
MTDFKKSGPIRPDSLVRREANRSKQKQATDFANT